MKIKLTLFVLFCISLCSSSLLAQQEEISVLGKVIDAQTQEAIEYATIMIANKENQQPITGITTASDGTFEITVSNSNFYVEVTFIGFLTQTIQNPSIVNGKVNLGTIALKEDKKTLEEVVVQAERSQTEFQLDKRIFRVGKDLTSTGASVLEVLNNVPSVNVNIEGEVSLRGSTGVQILINGKPSVLTSDDGNALGTITAEMVDRIEVITNPSAKYDAEGTSGIINIVIKKDDRRGTNGSISLNTGTPANHSVGISLNRRTEKFNLFSQFGVGYRKLPNDVENLNIAYALDPETNLRTSATTIRSEGKEFRNENFYNFNLGADYYINESNVLTVAGNFAYEIEEQPSAFNFTELDEEGAVISQWTRNETTEATNPKIQYELQYKSEFKGNEDHNLIFSALGNSFAKDLTSDFVNTPIFSSDNDRIQATRSDFKEAIYTFKLDYTRPFNEQITLETGAQYVINNVENDYAVSELVGDDLVADPDFTNIFEYDQDVLGVYATGAYEGDKWGVKLGLRLENTDLNTFLVNGNQRNNLNFINLFPSFHTSLKLSEVFSVQAGYSRRIRRPRLWDLNPFFNIRNNFNIREGNPELQPEFTDSYEVSSIYVGESFSWNFSVYHRYTTDVIERISFVENGVNTVRPLNLGTNQATGIEINGKYTPTNWLSINGDFNYNYFNREGSLDDDTNVDFNAGQWTAELNSKIKLPAQFDFEITGQYESSFRTVQGKVLDILFGDLGLRKKIMEGRGVLNFSIRDIFASRIRENETEQPSFFVYGRRLRGRFITFGFSYGFGKGEAMEFSGRRRR